MPGRIESYIHSDAITPNKAGCLVEVVCETDFAAKTEEFTKFSQKAAKTMYAFGARSWKDLLELQGEGYVSDFIQEKQTLEDLLGESISVRQVAILKLASDSLLRAEREGLKGEETKDLLIIAGCGEYDEPVRVEKTNRPTRVD